MHPHLITLPGGWTVQAYGFCLAIAFATGTLLARRRAKRAGADAEVVLRVALLAVVFGVGGARLLYVVHYWPSFASHASPLFAVLDLRKGGLEFIGGFVCATLAIVLYLKFPRRIAPGDGRRRGLPMRLYLDVLSPSVMWGLGITRIGCFLNGCCFGGPCVAQSGAGARYLWAVRFPYGSPAFVHQWERGQTTAPDELVYGSERERHLIPRATLTQAAQVDMADLNGLTETQSREKGGSLPGYLIEKLREPSRNFPGRSLTLAELREIAQTASSLPVHPAQLYAMVNALLLNGLLSALFRARRRHGVVFAALLILYPVSRFILEIVRVDNPRDTVGLTVSQFFCIVVFVMGNIVLITLHLFPEKRFDNRFTAVIIAAQPGSSVSSAQARRSAPKVSHKAEAARQMTRGKANRSRETRREKERD